MGRTTAVDPIDTTEESSDLGQLGRSAVWAGLAVSAMLAAVLAARSETGLRRITVALSGTPNPTPFAQTADGSPSGTTRDRAADAETRHLAETVRRLAADRDRLVARLDAIERSIDVTGALPPAAGPPPTDGTAASVTFVPPPPNARTAGHGPGGAEAPPTTSRAEQAAGESVVTRTEFGIDLGAAPNMDALRALWSTVKAQHGALFEGLRPVAAPRDTGKAGAVELRLIAGPLINAAAAARLCAVVAGTGRACQPSVFDSQRQALR